jgi:16S rRNA (uracil1498-N3)-methyltransferase
MALPYFYVKDPAEDDVLWLDEPNSKHAIAVLRLQEGEQLHLTDGKGQLLTAAIVSPHKKKCAIRLLEKTRVTRPQARVSIAISPVKNTARFEWFLEKATEIGVAEIIPLICQRTEKLHFRFERMEQILISAMLQSQQVWLPHLHEPQAFNKVTLLPGFDRKWIAHCLPTSRRSLREEGVALTDQLLLIGPEGDFTPAEIESAILANCFPVTLGNTRLRTETAGMAGATLLCIG